MNAWFFIVLPLAAGMGWCFTAWALMLLFKPLHPKKILGFSIQGILPKRKEEIAERLGKLGASLISVGELEEKITQPENIKKIMPLAAEHIDHFLRVKLVKSMPVVGMFVGDKTINNLKALFMTELEDLFPQIMAGYLDGLKTDLDIAAIIREKINAYPVADIERAFRQALRKELGLLKLSGACIGLLIGLVQVIVALIAIK